MMLACWNKVRIACSSVSVAPKTLIHGASICGRFRKKAMRDAVRCLYRRPMDRTIPKRLLSCLAASSNSTQRIPPASETTQRVRQKSLARPTHVTTLQFHRYQIRNLCSLCSHLIQKISQHLFCTFARCVQSHCSSHSAVVDVRSSHSLNNTECSPRNGYCPRPRVLSGRL
jgi:hypothetical protein